MIVFAPTHETAPARHPDLLHAIWRHWQHELAAQLAYGGLRTDIARIRQSANAARKEFQASGKRRLP